MESHNLEEESGKIIPSLRVSTEEELLRVGAVKDGNDITYLNRDLGIIAGWHDSGDGVYRLAFMVVLEKGNLTISID